MAHVARCEPCRQELVGLRQLRSLLAGASTPNADHTLVQRLSHLPASTLPGHDGSEAPHQVAQHRSWPGSRRVRRTAAVAGGATAVAAMLAWGAATAASVTPPAAPLQLVVPSVDRYGLEHAASVDSFPLAAPGSAVMLVSYGGAAAAPAAAAPPAVRHLLP